MPPDPSVSSRIITNGRLRRSQGWATCRDLGGALACTSDAPTADANRLEAFTSDDARIEGLLDVGFALLRAFDREPAALLTPLDRPVSLAERLAARGLVRAGRSVAMRFTGAPPSPARAGPHVAVRRAGPEDAPAFAAVRAAGQPRWARELLLSSTREGLLQPGNTHYLAHIGEEAVGTLQLLVDGATAGIYAAATLPAHRRQGVCSALLAAAVADALAAGCDVIGLETEASGGARRLFASVGFSPVHEATLWAAPVA